MPEVVFLRPVWLVTLVPLGLLIWRLWRSTGDGSAELRRAVDAHLLKHLLVGAPPGRRRMHLLLPGAGACLAVLALAGPALSNGGASSSLRHDAARVLVVELSGRMDAESRLERAKPKLASLLSRLPGGQTGLIVYAEEPYLVTPLTSDTANIALIVPELASDAAPLAGNRAGPALRLAAQMLDASGAARRDIVWITAGAETGSPPEAGDRVRLSVLHAAAAPDAALEAAARAGGGAYVRLGADDADVRALVATLAADPRWVAGTAPADGRPRDLGPWLLLGLLPLAAAAFRPGVLIVLALPLLGLLAGPPPAQALDFASRDQRALRLLQSGNAEAAAQAFDDPRWRAVAYYRAGRFEQAVAALEGLTDADSHYNRGNALAQLKQYPAALDAYEAALRLRPDDADARYNRDLMRRLAEPDKAPQTPPKPPPKASPRDASRPADRAEAEREAARVAEQWLRSVPDQPGGLLRAKLRQEHERRHPGGGRP